MANLPKPLIGLLLGTVAFFAIWMVALKPSSSSSSGASQGGVGQYQPAINQAHQAVTTSNQANAKLGAPTATAPAPKPATPAKTAAPATTAARAKTAAKTSAKASAKPSAKTSAKSPAKPAIKAAPVSAADEVKAIENAVSTHKVVAVLFYNPAAADDQAMKAEIDAIPTHGGQVVKFAVPVSELTQFQLITSQVQVITSPTLVLIDRARQATAMTGYADGIEIAQRIDDALATK